jgi:hypothetical protein
VDGAIRTGLEPPAMVPIVHPTRRPRAHPMLMALGGARDGEWAGGSGDAVEALVGAAAGARDEGVVGGSGR